MKKHNYQEVQLMIRGIERIVYPGGAIRPIWRVKDLPSLIKIYETDDIIMVAAKILVLKRYLEMRNMDIYPREYIEIHNYTRLAISHYKDDLQNYR